MTTDFEPFSRTYTSQGLNLHYLDWGNEEAPLVVLLHGMRDHAHSWDWTARALRDRFHVIAPDLRGHGDSDWSPDGAYLAAYHLLDLADLLAALGTRPAALVAHSFSGNFAARFTAMYPERVSKLVLVDGLGPSQDVLRGWAERGPLVRTREWLEGRRRVATQKPRRFATIEEGMARMIAANRHLTTEHARYLTVHGVRRYEDGYGWKYDPVIGIFLPEDFCVDLAAFWREITVPTLLCYGLESWTSNPETDGRAQCFRKHRTVVFENAGHWLHHEQLDAFVATLREFL